MFLEAAEDNRP